MRRRGKRTDATRPAPRRRTHVKLILPNDSREALPYVAKWHEVDAWAYGVIRGDAEPYLPPSSRVTGWRGVIVRDLNDDEEALEDGVPLENFGDIVPPGPTRKIGGTRRVSIRLHTWEIKWTKHGAFASRPMWITSGWGMSARAASLAHHDYIESYADDLENDLASRILHVTAMEIIWYTAGHTTDYV